MKGGRKTVLTVLPSGAPIAQEALAGIRSVADACRWRFISIDGIRNDRGEFLISRSPQTVSSFADLCSVVRPDGLILWSRTLSPDDVRKTLGARAKCVFIESSEAETERCVCVSGDSVSIAALATRELLLTDRADFAFVPYAGEENWDVERGAEFKRLILLAGKRFHAAPAVSAAAEPKRRNAAARGRGGSATAAGWLAALPKPCGIFAANDLAAERIAGECAALGLRVPNDVAIVGVDDTEYICENSTPTLSSVVQDIYSEGVAAAQMLSEWMDNPRRAPASRTVPAARIVRRASSRVVLDDRVARALETIRLHACDEGFGPPDVVRAMCLSRAPAFRLFKRIDGRTILDEIHAVRLERAMSMLVEGRRADAVASACGYASVADFRRVFRKRVGETVRNWTNSQRTPSR